MACAGAHTLRFGCTMWVYNCTGLPISLRQSMDSGSLFAEPELPLDDEVPDAWLPPLKVPGQALVPAPTPTSGGGGALPPAHPGLSPIRDASSGLRAVSRELPMRPGTASNLGASASAPSSVLNVSRVTSLADMPGLGEILEAGSPSGGAGGSQAGGGTDGRQVLGLKRTVSRARGIADSMESVPTFETPSRRVAGGSAAAEA